MGMPGAREPVTRQGPHPAHHPAEGVQGQGKTERDPYMQDAGQVLANKHQKIRELNRMSNSLSIIKKSINLLSSYLADDKAAMLLLHSVL